jgi:peroxiredoxin Q/BCP
MLSAYGVWQEKNLYGRKSMGIARTTYIIDREGKIQHVFPKVKMEGHVLEVLGVLKS